MKILITENQLKLIIENVIKEENYNVYKDPKALALISFLNEKMNEEVGLMNIINKMDYIGGMILYRFDDDREYIIGTDEESNKAAHYIAKEMIYDDPFIVGNDFIIEHSSVLNKNKISYQLLDLLRDEKPENGKLIGPYVFDKLIDNFDQFIADTVNIRRADYISSGVEKEFKFNEYYIYPLQ